MSDKIRGKALAKASAKANAVVLARYKQKGGYEIDVAMENECIREQEIVL